MLFDKNGMLCIDELVSQQPTFRKIMEDGVITDEEIKEQSALTLSILKRIEGTFDPEQLKEVQKLLTEMSVLFAIYKYREIRDIHN